MTITYKKVGDEVYMIDSENPMVARRISGTSYLNAPSNAVQVGPNRYNTPENIKLMEQAKAYFAKQEEEQKKLEYLEASRLQAQRQAEAQAQVTSVPHVSSPEYRSYLESIEPLNKYPPITPSMPEYRSYFESQKQEQEKKIAQNIVNMVAPTITKGVIGKIIEKIKKETVGAPTLQEARIDKATYQIQQQTQPSVETKIATPISLDETPGKKIEVAFAGGIATILARIGSAIWNFISKNPKVTGTTISTTALSNAITQTAQTEQEKNQIIKEIAQQNPQLAEEIAQTKTSPFANIADMEKYAVLGIFGIVILKYLLSKK